MTQLAQLPTKDLGTIGGDDGFGPFSEIGENATEVITNLATAISNLIGFITILAGLWFGFQFLIGAFQWTTSGGDKAGLEAARNRLIHAFIGLIIVVATWAIIAIIGTVLGLDILISNPKALCEKLSPNPEICQ